MATTTVTITGNVRDLIDGTFGARRTKAKVYVKHNTPYVVDADGDHVRLGSATVDVNYDDGSFELPDVIASVDTVENLQATVYVDYVDPMMTRAGRTIQPFGPYDLSAETGTVDISDLEVVQHLDPSFVSETMTAMQALLDEMEAISGLTGEDEAVALLLGDDDSDTAGAADTRAQAVIDAHDADDTTASGDKRFTGLFGWGEATPRPRTPNWQQYSMNADEVDDGSLSGSTVNFQRTSLWKGDFNIRATVTITATGGTAAWTIGGQTANIAYDASAATVKSALVALSSVGSSTYLDVTGGPGGSGGGTPYVVTYKPVYVVDFGFRELTVDGALLTGPGAGRTITWDNKYAVDPGYGFVENVYGATGTSSGDADGLCYFQGPVYETTHRSNGTLGLIVGSTAEVSWSGAGGTGPVTRMIGFVVTAGRHKNNEGAGILIDGTAREVYGLYVNGVAEGRTVTDAVTTNGSAVVTSATARFLTLAHRGRVVTGTGIPANTYIVSCDSATQVTLSNNCTASGTITMTLAATAGATTARTALFGYGTTEFQGRTDHKPGYKSESAARFYAYPGAASNDMITEWFDIDGTTRKAYVTNLGLGAFKHRLVAHESNADGQVSIGSNSTEAGTTAAVFFGTDNNVYLYRRAGYKVLGVKADNSLRLGRAATASIPSVTSLGGAGSERSAHLFYDTDLDKLKWSTQSAWKEAANVLYATATLDFPSVAAGGQQELTITVTGATTGDTVALGAPAAIEAGLVWNGYVSAADTVKVRVSNITGSPIDPASATWKATVTR